MRRAARIGWMEWARAFGACGVVLLHVMTSTSLACDLDETRLKAYAVAGIVLGRWAVPAFFMITGMLLLDPNREVSWAKARSYAKRMVLVIATFGFAFALMERVWLALEAGDVPTLALVPTAVLDVLCARSWDHMWYVYALVPVYLLVPALRALYARLGERRFAWFALVLYLGVLVVPTLVRIGLVWLGEGVEVPQEGPMAFAANVAVGIACACIGGALRQSRLNPLMGMVGGISVVVMLGMSLQGLSAGEGDMGFIFLQGSCFSCAYAAFVLLLLRANMGDAPLRKRSLADRLARESFGIYVLHPLFVHLALLAIDPLAYVPGLFEAGFLVVVVAASAATTRLLRHVPRLGTLL